MTDPPGRDPGENGIWGSCSRRQSEVPRPCARLVAGSAALHYRDGDRARRIAASISCSLVGDRPCRLVPLRGARWEVADTDLEAGLVGQASELGLPQPDAVAVAAAA